MRYGNWQVHYICPCGKWFPFSATQDVDDNEPLGVCPQCGESLPLCRVFRRFVYTDHPWWQFWRGGEGYWEEKNDKWFWVVG